MNIVTTHWYTRHVLFSCVAVLVIISYGARDHLYCTQPELPLAYENPTLFCQLSGRLACQTSLIWSKVKKINITALVIICLQIISMTAAKKFFTVAKV